MSHADDHVGDHGTTRRDFLYFATAGAGTIAAGAAAWTLVNQMNPSADVQALSSIQVDVSGVAEGTQLTVKWLGKPVFIRRRTAEKNIPGDWAARAEAQFPLGLPEEYGIKGGLFADAGSVWGLQNTTGYDGVEVDDGMHVRAAVGASLFWTTPIGPLRFNFSHAVKKEYYDEEQNFDLTISTRF